MKIEVESVRVRSLIRCKMCSCCTIVKFSFLIFSVPRCHHLTFCFADDTLVDSHPLLRNLLDSSLDFDAELDSIVHSFGMTHFVLVEIPKGLRFDVKSTRSGKTMHYSWDEIDDENEDSNFSTPVSRFPCSPLDSYPTLSFFASALSSALHWIADDIFLEEEDLSQEVKSTLDGDVERRKVLLKRSLLSSLSYFVRPLSTPTEQFPTLFGRCFAISLNHPEWIPQPLSEDFSPLPEWKDAISSLSHSSHVVDAEFFDEKISVVPAHCTHLSGLLELLSLRIVSLFILELMFLFLFQSVQHPRV